MLFRGLLLVVASVLAAACRPSAPPESPSEVVQKFFISYNGNFRQADSAAFSRALRDAVASAVSIEQKSRAAVKASDFPSDKPQLIEGEIFSGLSEGFTGHRVGSEQVSESAAVVDVNFTNSHYAVAWTDRVQLIREDGKWKIDDVRYLDKKAGALGVRDVLRDFEQMAARDPLLNPPK